VTGKVTWRHDYGQLRSESDEAGDATDQRHGEHEIRHSDDDTSTNLVDDCTAPEQQTVARHDVRVAVVVGGRSGGATWSSC
jgi:hypothetical protein